MTTKIQHFLLIFDHEAGHLIGGSPVEFGEDSDAAVAAYGDRERKYQNEKRVEIVLIGSDSLETVMLTHANYFDGTAAVSKYLVDIS